MTNKCEACPKSCCVDFKIAKEFQNPTDLQEELAKFPFIKRTRSEIILDPCGYDRLVGVYNCDRFDLNNRTCLDYYSQERPSFCLNTGVTSVPNEQCLLKSNLNERKKA